MNLNIENQIPILSKVYKDMQIYLPVSIQKGLNLKVGDKIELFATTEGIFLKKRRKNKWKKDLSID